MTVLVKGNETISLKEIRKENHDNLFKEIGHFLREIGLEKA